MSTTTQRIEEELGMVSDTDQTGRPFPPAEPAGQPVEADTETCYRPPLVEIVHHTSTGDDTDESLRVMIQDGRWAATGGDVAVMVEAVTKAVHAATRPAATAPQQMSLVFNASTVPASVVDRLAQRAAKLGEDGLRAELARAQQDQQECAREHRDYVAWLRGLIAQARDDARAAADAEQARTAQAPGEATGDGGDLGDAVQATTGGDAQGGNR